MRPTHGTPKARPRRGKALFSRHSFLSGHCPVPSHPRNHRPLRAHLTYLSISTPLLWLWLLLWLLRLLSAPCAVQNAHPCQQPAPSPSHTTHYGSVREKKPASHFRASKRTLSKIICLPSVFASLPLRNRGRGGSRKEGANPRSWSKTTRRPTRSHGYILVPHWQAHCLGSPAIGASLLGHLLLGCTPPSSTSLCITTTRPERRPSADWVFFLTLGSGCLYTPSLQTAHHHHRPCGASFLPSLLIFAVRQVDSNSQSPPCVIYARSLYHNIIQIPQYRLSVVIPGQPRGRFHLVDLRSICVRLVNSSLSQPTALP